MGADVSQTDQVEAAVGRVAGELGAPSVLVNNAGLLRDNLLFKMSDSDWDTVLDVHLKGSFLMTRATQKYMVEQHYGRIVNTSSSSALGNRGQANYSAAKAGLQGFTKTLAIELGPLGITANAVAPGFIATDMTAATAARVKVPFEDFIKAAAERNPVRRVGYPEDIAHTVSFLVSEGAGYVSGQVIYVAGGRCADWIPAHRGRYPGPGTGVPGRHRPGLHPPAGLPARPVRRWAGLGALPARARRAGRAAGPAGRRGQRVRGGRAPDNSPAKNVIGLGMAAPTILTFGNDAQRGRWLRPLWTAEDIWCQLFSEPGAGSDLASLATRAVRDPDGDWIVSGQKVWTSLAHQAHGASWSPGPIPRTEAPGPELLRVRHDRPGVDVRPLRQLTGEAEFNEVFLTDVRIPDTDRIGAVGEGWKVATGTLMNERVAIGGTSMPREGGMIGGAARAWREHPEQRTPGLHDRMLRLWAEAEIARLGGLRLRQQLAAGQPGPEGSAAKIVFARLNQEISGFEVELAGPDGLRYDDYTMRRPEHRRLHRPRPWLPLPAGQGQLDRGRDL